MHVLKLVYWISMIMVESNLCNNSTNPANSTNKNNDNLWSQIVNFLSIPNIIVIGVTIPLLLSMIYACTCFDKRKPPVLYGDIEWEKGVNWTKH
jgi:hypothetical protein